MHNRVLVTGAGGFIGRRLVSALCGSGIQVRALLRPSHDASEMEAEGIEIVRGDAADAALMKSAAAQCDVIYHLAAARGFKKLSGRNFAKENTALIEAAAGAAQDNTARLVLASSVAVMRGRPPLTPARSEPRPTSHYGASRMLNEKRLHEVWRNRQLDYRIARIAERVAGPGAKDWQKIVRAVRDGRYRLIARGGQIHSCDVDDVVAGLQLCAGDRAEPGATYILVARDPAALKDVFASIADELGVAFAPRMVSGWPLRAYKRIGDQVFSMFGLELPHAFTAGFHAWPSHYDTAATSERLGFAPRYDVLQAVRRTVGWMRAEGAV